MLAETVDYGCAVLEGPIVKWTNEALQKLKAELQFTLDKSVWGMNAPKGEEPRREEQG
jgi:hypothetical protein